MLFETRFDPSDRVWILDYGKPVKKTVHSVIFTESSSRFQYVTRNRVGLAKYFFRKWEQHLCMDLIHREPTEVFATKDEAIKYWVEQNK